MPLFLLFLFVVVPIAELYVIIKVGGWIGVVPTIALLIFASIAGAALARSQGRAVWQRFNLALAEGRVPGREVFDGAMIIFGGALLLTPGFLSDVLGIVLLVPPTRALLRKLLSRTLTRRAGVAWRVTTFGARRAAGRPGSRARYDYEGSAREVDDPPPQLPRHDG